ncbi:hypothetical protein BD413DRAFT_105629 [Trametes elegans]|nr:hypothetical protein BD413DRAFT_105629 [Trametes elegans]
MPNAICTPRAAGTRPGQDRPRCGVDGRADKTISACRVSRAAPTERVRARAGSHDPGGQRGVAHSAVFADMIRRQEEGCDTERFALQAEEWARTEEMEPRTEEMGGAPDGNRLGADFGGTRSCTRTSTVTNAHSRWEDRHQRCSSLGLSLSIRA